MAVANEMPEPISVYHLDEWLQSCQTFEVDEEQVRKFRFHTWQSTKNKIGDININVTNGLDCSTFLALNDEGKMVFYTGEEKEESIEQKLLVTLIELRDVFTWNKLTPEQSDAMSKANELIKSIIGY